MKFVIEMPGSSFSGPGYPMRYFDDNIGDHERIVDVTGDAGIMLDTFKLLSYDSNGTDPKTHPVTEAMVLADRLEEYPDEMPDGEARDLLVLFLRSCGERGRVFPYPPEPTTAAP